jgi:hypothetical protein
MGVEMVNSSLAFEGNIRIWRCGEGEPTYFAEFERDGKRYEASGETPPLAVRRLFDELVDRGFVA